MVKNESSGLKKEDIIAYCKERLSDYKIPEIVFTDSLPKNRLGKIVKKICANWLLKDSERSNRKLIQHWISFLLPFFVTFSNAKPTTTVGGVDN